MGSRTAASPQRDVRYSSYGLRKNPFPTIPITSSNKNQQFFPEIRNREILEFRKHISHLFPKKHGIIFLRGKTGSGKSALLKYLCENVDRFFEQSGVIPIYASLRTSPTTSQLYREVLSWLKPAFFPSIARKISQMHEKRALKIRDNVSTSVSVWRAMRAPCRECSFQCNRDRMKRFEIVYDIFRSVENEVDAYLSLYHVWITHRLGSLITILDLIALAGFQNIILGIDGLENEFPYIDDARRWGLFWDLHVLVKCTIGKIILVCTVNDSILRWLESWRSNFLEVFSDFSFVSPPKIEIGDISVDQLKFLIAGYLGKARGRARGRYLKGDINPFTDKAIQKMYNHSGSLREALVLCWDALEFCTRNGLQKISANAVHLGGARRVRKSF